MSVYEYITENIFLFGGFWIFACVLGLVTAVIFRRSGYQLWVKIIGILGSSAVVHFLTLALVTRIFDQRYLVSSREVQVTNTVADLALVPMQVIGMAAMPTLNAIFFNACFSTALWLLVLGGAIFKLRTMGEVRQ